MVEFPTAGRRRFLAEQQTAVAAATLGPEDDDADGA